MSVKDDGYTPWQSMALEHDANEPVARLVLKPWNDVVLFLTVKPESAHERDVTNIPASADLLARLQAANLISTTDFFAFIRANEKPVKRGLFDRFKLPLRNLFTTPKSA